MDTSFLRWLGIGEKPKFTYNNKVHYQIDKTAYPPVYENIEIPAKSSHYDMMCFYFTYPQELTAWTKEGDWGACRTVVELDYPHSSSAKGRRNTLQLYSQRGQMGMESNTWNHVCVVVQEYDEIPPGKGKITWSVDGRKCNSVPFNVK